MFKKLRELMSGESGAKANAIKPIQRDTVVPLISPFELVAARGKDVHASWLNLQKRPGIVPVLLGDRENAADVLGAISEHRESPDEIIAQGTALDIEAWMRERIAGDPECYKIDESQTGSVAATELFVPARDILSQKPHAEIFFALVPAVAPWHVPAYLKFGAWNDCPDPVVHLAFFKRWYERHGAIVTTVAHDIVEFTVTNPPKNKVDALVLAKEQYIYCYDIVEQGVGTVGNLAASLNKCPNWYFWWD